MDDTGSAPEVDEVTLRIGVAWRELRRGARMQELRRLLASVGDRVLEPGQVDTLDLLVTHGELRMSELAEVLRVDASTATRAVASLETIGLAERTTPADDARARMVRASPRGAELRHRLLARRREVLLRALEGFDGDERERLAELLERLIEGIDRVVIEETDASG